MDSDVAARRLIRFVLDESGWKDLTAEVERLRVFEERWKQWEAEVHPYIERAEKHAAEYRIAIDRAIKAKHEERDLCDKLAEALEWEHKRRLDAEGATHDHAKVVNCPACTVLALHQERK